MTTVPVARPRRRSSAWTSQNRAKTFFVAGAIIPLTLYMLFWTLFPMVWAVTLAFFDYNPANAGSGLLGLGGANPFVGLEHFREMFGASLEAQKFRASLRNTLIFSFLVLPLNLMITIPLAMAIEAIDARLKTVYRFIYFLPTVTASVGVALIWGYLYHPQQGLLNMIIKALGGDMVIWLTDPRNAFLGVPVAMWAVIITYLWWDMGYNLVIFIAALQGIPREFREAAQVDGATGWQMFWRILLPLLRPTLLFVCVLTMISSFQVFDIIQIMTSGGPQDQTRVMVLDIYLNAFRFGNMGWAGATSLVLFALIFIVTLIQTRLLRSQWEY
ncbi:MAG TPA: sugar ABC transporter permease [Caldilineaceae bacterium]|nr:sugar ABC transporter permease [Caldilineaceae bacterium]